jgi:hypothetical protein
MDELPLEDAVAKVISRGNYPDGNKTQEDSGNNYVPSPFEPTLKAYGGKGPGQVDIILSEEPTGMILQGYDGKGDPIPSAKKFVPAEN